MAARSDLELRPAPTVPLEATPRNPNGREFWRGKTRLGPHQAWPRELTRSPGVHRINALTALH